MYYRDDPFPYAKDYVLVIPRGIEDRYGLAGGSIVIQDDYSIYFKPNTPDDIKERFIKDYAKYYKKDMEAMFGSNFF